jgi:hypothetical protein
MPVSENIQMVQHSGGIPGSSSLVSFFPGDGLGVVVLINADEKELTSVAITDRVVDDMLGLSSIELDRYFVSSHRRKYSSSTSFLQHITTAWGTFAMPLVILGCHAEDANCPRQVWRDLQ